MKQFTIQFYGNDEAIRKATHIADHIFRQCYNVYGGRRAESKKGYCRMIYEAYWKESGLCSYSWIDVWDLISEKLLRLGYAVSSGAKECNVWGE